MSQYRLTKADRLRTAQQVGMTDDEIKQALKDLEEIEARKAANKARAKR